MADRTRSMQTAHDERVAAHARSLSDDGWNVRADVEGWDQPPTIAGHRPDIYATKPGSTRIVEVETDPDDDPGQHTAFRRHAAQKRNTKFYGLVAGPNGGHAGVFE